MSWTKLHKQGPQRWKGDTSTRDEDKGPFINEKNVIESDLQEHVSLKVQEVFLRDAALLHS